MKSILTSLFSLVLCATLHAQIPSYVPSDGLVGWWPFNGNANDESGNGNHGVVNGATLAEDRFGNANMAYSFDGVNDLIDVSLLSPPDTFVTFSAWLKTTSNSQTAISFDLSNGLFVDQDGTISFNDNNGDWGIIPSNSIINDDIWHHIVVETKLNLFEYNYNNGQNSYLGINSKIFVDGVLEYELNQGNYSSQYQAYLEPFFDNTLGSEMNIGMGRANPQFLSYLSYFNGSIDDISIWNRALSIEEIEQLYTQNSAPCNLIASETQDTPVEVGGSAQMYVTLNATDYSMQWQTNAAGLGWMDVQDNNTYTGSQTQNLLISNATLANHEQPFRIIVKDGICNDTSDVAMLIVNNTCTAYDTITNVVEVFDTLTIENVIDVFDTTTVFNTIEVFDTLTVYNTVDVFDTTEVVVEVFDTITNVIDVFDTTTIFLQVDIFDTLFIDVYDTTYVTFTDTTYIQVIDTAYVTVTDTLLIDITFVGFEGQPSWLNTVLVYPNPASDHITIDYGNFELMAGYNTIITNAAGATVYSGAVNSQQATIDINAWGAAGIYYMSIYDVNGAVMAVRQIVLE
jgi:hypothetical protein